MCVCMCAYSLLYVCFYVCLWLCQRCFCLSPSPLAAPETPLPSFTRRSGGTTSSPSSSSPSIPFPTLYALLCNPLQHYSQGSHLPSNSESLSTPLLRLPLSLNSSLHPLLSHSPICISLPPTPPHSHNYSRPPHISLTSTKLHLPNSVATVEMA